MTDNPLPAKVGKYTRAEIEQFYQITLTDKQWKLLADYADKPDEEYETEESLIVDFIDKMELLEEVADEYEKLIKQYEADSK